MSRVFDNVVSQDWVGVAMRLFTGFVLCEANTEMEPLIVRPAGPGSPFFGPQECTFRR